MLLSHLWLLVSWFLSLSLYPQGCFLTMTVSWYQSLIKVLLSRFPQSCRHFHNAETGTQYLVRPSPLPTHSCLPFLGPLPAVASHCLSLMVQSGQLGAVKLLSAVAGAVQGVCSCGTAVSASLPLSKQSLLSPQSVMPSVSLRFGSATREPSRLAPPVCQATHPACQCVPGWVFITLPRGLCCLLLNVCCGSLDRLCSTRSSQIASFLCFWILIQERR